MENKCLIDVVSIAQIVNNVEERYNKRPYYQLMIVL